MLGSGSAGNCLLLRNARTKILIDAGMTARQVTLRLAACGTDPAELDGIVLTHEHSDHTGALRVLCAQHALPVYANALTAEALRFNGLDGHREWRVFTTGSEFQIGSLRVRAFSVPHDAADPVGMVVQSDTAAFGVLTDLGFATRSVAAQTGEVDGILIEANYDEELLERDMKRPWSVKQRIASRHGHLSNKEAAALLRDLATPRLKQIVLGHLSRDCNTPDHALAAVRAALPDPAPACHCARQEQPSPVFCFP